MDSQFQSNKTVSEYIQKTNPNEIIKNYLSDEEFDDSEKEKIKNIIKTKQKIKNSQTGMAMNAGKDEFLTPKDIYKAKEDVVNLSESIEIDNMYTMNASSHDMVVEDCLEGESWINNQILHALGVEHLDTEQNLLAPYQSGSNPNDLVETAEMRAIKRDLDKPVNEYVNELDLQIDQLQLSIKRNKDTKESIAKGITSHEKEVETAEVTIRENLQRFKILIEITGVIEDLCSMLDGDKEHQINQIYKQSKLIKSSSALADDEHEFTSKPQKRGLGFRKSKFDQPAESKQEDSDTKVQPDDIKTQYDEIFKDVKEEFQTPEKLFALFRLVYSEYDEGSKFGVDFDIIDFVDYIIPYYKIECIQKAVNISSSSNEDNNTLTIQQQVDELKLLLIGKNAEAEIKKLDRFYAEVRTQSDLEYNNYE